MEQQKRRIRCMGRGLMSLLLALALCLGLCVPALATTLIQPEVKEQVSIIRDGFYNEWELPFLSDYVWIQDMNGQTFYVPCSSYAYADEWAFHNVGEKDYACDLLLIVYRKDENVYKFDKVFFLCVNDSGDELQWRQQTNENEALPVWFFLPSAGGTTVRARALVRRIPDLTQAHDYLFNFNVVMRPFTRDDSGEAHLDNNTTTMVGSFFLQFDEKAANGVLSRRLTDVAEDSYCYDAVLWALRTNVTKGTTDTTFSPNDTCTRAQILTFIWRYSKEPEPTIANPYTDVTEDAYYYKAALWAYEKGMVTGTEFNGSTPCTRASTMEYLWKLRGSPKTDGAASFEDVPAGADYAEAVAWAVKEKITNGVTDTTFAPERTCTRGNIVTFLERYSTREVIWDTLRQMDELIGKGTSEQAPPTDENPENAPPDGIPEGAPTDESPENMPPES